jgi:hypothetical protein
MTPKQINLPDAYRGDSYGPLEFIFLDSNRNPVDISGASSVSCQVGNIGQTRDRQVVLAWSTGTSSVSLSGNVATLNAVSGEYMKMLPDIYYYDLQIVLDGYTRTYLRGNLTVLDEVTLY